MIPTLYPIFQKWSKNGSVYIVSDTHFYDADREIMGYDISEEEQIAILKKRCHKNDTLIHLGDVGDPSLLSEIKAYKVLIMGNHDETKTKFEKKVEMVDLDACLDEEIDRMLRKKEIKNISYEFHKPFTRGYRSNGLFDEVYTGPLWVAEKLVLSHEPLCLESGLTRRPIAFNIHGHDHSGEYYNDDYHLNLAQNVFGYEPLDLKDFIRDGMLKHIKSIHREIIDTATERKKQNLLW